ncbi:M50 family metallopeptidase [Cellulomonas sp.]|uniref:M50 family metallopeptidase n=1 Tax=Cellulomonas sp. TaxID=40001 RepID=UPI0025828C02|nr:M50 family metallopeptidase [Cellulomonas sp.]MCR6688630.1 M50 family metallopeptidase [Cellulomonas sp.]
MDWVREWWQDVTTPSAVPSVTVVALTGVAVLVVLAVPVAWRVARHALTIVHEAGHAVVALLVGRQVSGITVHSDTSGLTLSRGRPRGPGMVATAFAGYPAPAVVGVGAAALLARGYDVALLWGLLALVAGVLVAIRNWYGLWAVLVSLAVLVAVTGWGTPAVQAAFAYVVTWFFLLGAPRAVLEMQSGRRSARRRGARDTSDAGLLGGLTHTPGALWVGVLGLVTLAALGLGGAWLVGLQV